MERTTQWSRKRRHQKLSHGKQKNMPSIDRLSALPDDVICHILSFLRTKISVSTSILSRRWRYLWAHVPSLDFDSTNLCLRTNFSNIISTVMLLHKVQSINTFRLCYTNHCKKSINTFRFCYTNHCENYAFETWITIAIARNVHIIHIRLNYCNIILPQCLFTCKTLVDLRLDCCRVIISLSGAIFLPCLKKLHLFRVKYDGGENLPKLFSGCPVLEELIMARFEEDELVCCNIFSPSIKMLMLDFPYNLVGYYNHDYRVEINAPAIRYLQLKDSVSTHISSQMLTSLIEADFSFDYKKDDEEQDNYFQSVYKFIDSLCNVKCLKLSSHIELEHDGAFDDKSESIRRFDNLTKLELAADWYFLTIFLESADNLEVLIIREVHKDLKQWTKPEKVPTCLLSHLRTVRIDGFEFTEHEFEVIRYLLMNAKVLDRMEVYSRNYYWFGFKAKSEALQRTSLFQRGCDACELAFY